MVFQTRLTQLLNITTPIVSAPMAGATGGLLTAQVSKAGGFAFLSSGYAGLDKFKQELSIARSALKLPASSSTLPFGIGFLGWTLEVPGSAELAVLDFALENRPAAIWFAFGKDLGHWIKYVREFDAKTRRPNTLIFVQINTVEEALIAINDWKVDVLVAQGIEAGGHGSSYAPPLSILVPAILSAAGSGCPPLLGAGGLAIGSQIASVLTLGASGVVLGTRFLLSQESTYTDTQKKALLAANMSSTVRTTAFDHARNTVGWPEGVNGRGLHNELVDVFDRGDGVEAVQRKYEDGVKAQDPDRLVIWAGIGVGLMNEIKHAEDIVKELHEATLNALLQVHNIIVGM